MVSRANGFVEPGGESISEPGPLGPYRRMWRVARPSRTLLLMHDPQRFIDAYAQAMGLPDLPLSADGCARLRFDEQVAVNFEVEPRAERLHVFTVLGRAHDADAAFYRGLLEANLFTRETQGASLCIAPAQDEVLICRSLDTSAMEPDAFCSAMETFLAAAREWCERFESGAFTRDLRARDDTARFEQFGPGRGEIVRG